jgi:hypothetical protein
VLGLGFIASIAFNCTDVTGSSLCNSILVAPTNTYSNLELNVRRVHRGTMGWLLGYRVLSESVIRSMKRVSSLFTDSVILVGRSNELGDKKPDTWLMGVTAGPVDRLPPRGWDQQDPDGRADVCYLQCSKRPSSVFNGQR